VPEPSGDEERDAFISRCIRSLKHEDPSRSDEQAAAICYSQWRGEAMHPDFQRILVTFTHHYTDGTALERFHAFIANNGLDIAKAYHPLVQFSESLTWTEPLIQFYKQDTDAKYYGVKALTANISMNDNDYRDYQKLLRAAPSMQCKPVNYNHDPGRWLPFPRTRVDMVGMEDLAMELTLRVDNEDRYFQLQLDHDPSIPESEWINHPSIQGYENAAGDIEYLGCAFLERGVQLPGDPLTEIVPLILNESVRSQFCKIVDGLLVCESGVSSRSDLITMSENNEKKAWIHNCIQQGKSQDECEAQWRTQHPDAAEQMEETPPESTEMSDEERAFMDECTAGGKSREECAELWQHQLGAAQPPATTVPDAGAPTTPLSQEEPPATPLPAAPLPLILPPTQEAIIVPQLITAGQAR